MPKTPLIIAVSKSFEGAAKKAQGLSGMHQDLHVDYDSFRHCWIVWKQDKRTTR